MVTNKFLLNIVATITTTLPTGDLASDMKHRIFPLPIHPLLNKETALPYVRNVSDALSIPMHPSVLEKIMGSVRHVVSGDRRLVTMGGMPFVTVCISVDHGVVSADGEFDVEVDEYEYDDEDEDDDDEEEAENEEPAEKETEKGGDGGGGSSLDLQSVVVEEQGKICAICLEKFEVSCEATRLRCAHLYHHDCIGTWLQKGTKECPVCRSQIP